MPTHADLLTELNGLLRLTAIEADIARARSTQARDDAVREELLENARNADVRRLALQQAVSDLGGLPDLLGVALDRAMTAVRTQVLDQALPISQALMADLALEHQLRDRAAFARVLADARDERDVATMLGKIEAAHDAAIDWIETRLGEVALGGVSALVPTPLQSAAAMGQRVATLPTRAAAAGINRGIAIADSIADRLGRTREVAEDSLVAGREAFWQTAEQESADKRLDSTARVARLARSDVGTLTADELPIRRYETLNASQAVAAVDKLDDVQELQSVRTFETEHKDRASVIRAIDARTSELAGEAMS